MLKVNLVLELVFHIETIYQWVFLAWSSTYISVSIAWVVDTWLGIAKHIILSVQEMILL